jgi:hypothetical protein
VIFVLAVLTVIAVAASVFARRRGASPERRQQLAWLGYIGAFTVAWILCLVLAGWLAPGPSNGWLGVLLWDLVVLTPVVGIPLACVVAVLKYRLYDLGRIVSRTVTYAIVTGLLVGVYAGLVLLATQVVKITSPVAVAGATLAAAANASAASAYEREPACSVRGGVRGAAGPVSSCRGSWYRAGVGFIRCGCRDHAHTTT